MGHHICTGTCKGVSENPGTCQTEGCPKHNQSLKQCDCTDEQHHGRQEDADAKEKSEEGK